jgi:hypothetical protein
MVWPLRKYIVESCIHIWNISSEFNISISESVSWNILFILRDASYILTAHGKNIKIAAIVSSWVIKVTSFRAGSRYPSGIWSTISMRRSLWLYMGSTGGIGAFLRLSARLSVAGCIDDDVSVPIGLLDRGGSYNDLFYYINRWRPIVLDRVYLHKAK